MISTGYLLSFLCFSLYLAVYFIGPGKVQIPESSDLTDYEKCHKCLKPKPTGTHHCSVCNRCVPGMDHHCMWTNQCIGYRNRPIFLALLFVGSVSCWYIHTLTNHSNFQLFCFKRDSDLLGGTKLYDLTDQQKSMFQCSISDFEGQIIGWTSFVLIFISKIVCGLFCFNGWLYWGHDGISFIDWKK